MIFSAKGTPMTRVGLTNALSKLQLDMNGAAALWAVFEVETAGITQGYGFRPDRRPQILFERHKFSKFTQGVFDKTHPNISGKPGGYGTLAQQYPKLEEALALCQQAGLGEEPALKSVSWGIGQIMGFNHDAAGYSSAKSMVEAMVESEDAQLEAMVNFLVHGGLDKHMRNQNWDEFARRYNGANYAENKYDVKLQAQYARFSSGSLPDIEMRTAQAALLVLNFPPGKIDGVLGMRTRNALRSFQTAYGLPATGELTGDVYLKLYEAAFS